MSVSLPTGKWKLSIYYTENTEQNTISDMFNSQSSLSPAEMFYLQNPTLLGLMEDAIPSDTPKDS